MYHPVQAPLGCPIQQYPGRGWIHGPHPAGVSRTQAEHGACVDESVYPRQGGPKGIVIGEVSQCYIDAVGIQAVEDGRRPCLSRVPDHGPDLVSGRYRGGQAVRADKARGPGDGHLHTKTPLLDAHWERYGAGPPPAMMARCEPCHASR